MARIRVVRVVLGLAVVLLLAGCRDADTPAPAPSRERIRDPGPLLGIEWGPRIAWGIRGGNLVRLDARTLEPRARPRLALGAYGYSTALSPDGRTLALGGFRAGILLVDRRTLRPVRRLQAAEPPGLVLGLAWPARNRIVAAVGSPHAGVLRAAAVDPRTGRSLDLEESSGGRVVVEVEPDGRGGLVVLRARPDEIGPAELVHIRSGGAVRAIPLETIAGLERLSQDAPRRVSPGLAVDPEAGIAYVVAGGSAVERADLASAETSIVPLQPERSVLARLLGWLEPDAAAKLETGPVTDAIWLGAGLLAAAGYDVGMDGRRRPAGLRLVDAGAGTVTMLEPGADRVLAEADVVVALGGESGDGAPGVAAFTRDGDLMWRRFAGALVDWAEAARGRVYVHLGRRAMTLRLSDGRSLGPARRPLPLVLPDP